MRFAINQAGIQEDNMGVLAIVPVFIGWLVWQKTGNIIFGALAGVILEGILAAFLGKSKE